MMSFFANRWAGRVPLEQLFWRDMLFTGTAANLCFLAAAMTLAARDFSPWVFIPVFLVPLPYNLFVWQCVWNTTNQSTSGQRALVRLVSSLWLAAVIIL